MLAYLFPAFPVFHQTFVLWEVVGLRRNGVKMKIYSLRRPSAEQQPEGRQFVDEVTYLPGSVSSVVLRANWRSIRADYRRYLRLYGEIFKAWHSGPTGTLKDALAWDVRHVTTYDRVRGWFNTQPVLYLIKSLWLVPQAVYLAEQLARDGVSHLHVHWASYPATVAYVVHLISGLPFSISAHAYDIYMVPRMLPAKLAAARFVVTCAKANAAFLRRMMDADQGDRVIVSYHGVDVRRFSPRANGHRQQSCLTIASCGRLEHYKGMHHLIDACADLKHQGIAVQCWIVGDGPQRRRLQRQIETLGLSGQVQLLGARAHGEVAALLGTADVFVLASEMAGKFGRRDVIANVVVEAMAAGLPVVAAHVPGAEELVENGVTGYLTPPNHVTALSRAIAALANSPTQRQCFGQAGRARVLRDFDNSRNVRLLADLLSRSAHQGAERLTASVHARHRSVGCR